MVVALLVVVFLVVEALVVVVLMVVVFLVVEALVVVALVVVGFLVVVTCLSSVSSSWISGFDSNSCSAVFFGFSTLLCTSRIEVSIGKE